jgi:hypothetical protein
VRNTQLWKEEEREKNEKRKTKGDEGKKTGEKENEGKGWARAFPPAVISNLMPLDHLFNPNPVQRRARPPGEDD